MSTSMCDCSRFRLCVDCPAGGLENPAGVATPFSENCSTKCEYIGVSRDPRPVMGPTDGCHPKPISGPTTSMGKRSSPK